MIPCPTHGPTANYNTVNAQGKDAQGTPNGTWRTVHELDCGCKVSPHPKRREPVHPEDKKPGIPYEGEVFPDYELVLDPKDMQIARLNEQLAEANAKLAAKK